MDSNCRDCGNQGATKGLEKVEVERFSEDHEQHGRFDFVKYAQVDRCGDCGELTTWQIIWGDDFGDAVADRLLFPLRPLGKEGC